MASSNPRIVATRPKVSVPETCGVEAYGPCNHCDEDDSVFWCMDGKITCVRCEESVQWCPECADGPSLEE